MALLRKFLRTAQTPLRPENRELTIKAVKQTGADLAVAWDADADKCFFFYENGEFVEGCYITALLAECLLQKKGSGGVIFDPRAIWAVEDAVKNTNGTPILNRCGHSFIKARMRETDALFAGEASGHYYFRDNFYADNGMIPFLLILEHLCGKKVHSPNWLLLSERNTRSLAKSTLRLKLAVFCVMQWTRCFTHCTVWETCFTLKPLLMACQTASGSYNKAVERHSVCSTKSIDCISSKSISRETGALMSAS